MQETTFAPSEIRSIRHALGMTQVAFADYLGVGIATVQRWEGGYTSPLVHLLPKLERARRKADKIAAVAV